MERYELVRRSVLAEGMSEREASSEFGVNRRMVKGVPASQNSGYLVITMNIRGSQYCRVAAILVAGAMTLGCNRGGYQIDKNNINLYYIAEFYQDYFWWHHKRPKSFEELRHYFDGFHDRPSAKAVVSWDLKPEKVFDKETGLTLSRIGIKIFDGGITTSEVTSLDLMDPDRVWVVHYTYAPGYRSGTVAPTERNLANGLAFAVFQAYSTTRNPAPSWSDLDKFSDQDDVISIPTVRKMKFEIMADTIIIAVPNVIDSLQVSPCWSIGNEYNAEQTTC